MLDSNTFKLRSIRTSGDFDSKNSLYNNDVSAKRQKNHNNFQSVYVLKLPHTRDFLYFVLHSTINIHVKLWIHIRALDKVRTMNFIDSICVISSPNPMLDHLLEHLS